jgi:hypothetical protein
MQVEELVRRQMLDFGIDPATGMPQRETSDRRQSTEELVREQMRSAGIDPDTGMPNDQKLVCFEAALKSLEDKPSPDRAEACDTKDRAPSDDTRAATAAADRSGSPGEKGREVSCDAPQRAGRRPLSLELDEPCPRTPTSTGELLPTTRRRSNSVMDRPAWITKPDCAVQSDEEDSSLKPERPSSSRAWDEIVLRSDQQTMAMCSSPAKVSARAEEPTFLLPAKPSQLTQKSIGDKKLEPIGMKEKVQQWLDQIDDLPEATDRH